MTITSHASHPARLGIGIIGLSASGGWAKLAHVPAIEAVDGLELRALAASSAASAEAAGRRFGVDRVHHDPRALAEDPAVDLVVVTVKVSTHRALIEPALSAGKMVFCEWPLGNGHAESEFLAAAARGAGVRTAVGLQARATPALRYLRDLIADGYLGTVLSSTVTASGISWGAKTVPGKTYLLDRSEGASMLTIPVGHTLDALQFVLGEIAQIQAHTAIRRPVVRMTDTDQPVEKTVADQVALQGTLADGAVFSAHFRGGSSRGTNFEWEINGTDGDIVVSGDSGAFVQYGQLRIRGGHGEERELTLLPTPASYILVPELPEFGDHAFTVAHGYHQLRDDILNDTHTGPDFDHAARLHALLDVVEECARSGQRVSVPSDPTIPGARP